MSIVAKFHLSKLTLTGHSQAGAEMAAVGRGDRNASWAAATPSGNLLLGSLDLDEVAWIEAHRAQVRVADAADIAQGIRRFRGVEFMLWLDRPTATRPLGAAGGIVRHVEVTGIEQRVADRAEGVVTIESLTGPYVKLTLNIGNPAAFGQMRDAFQHGQREYVLSIEQCNDGYAGDGHPFVKANVPNTHYRSSACSECGQPVEAHAVPSAA